MIKKRIGFTENSAAVTKFVRISVPLTIFLVEQPMLGSSRRITYEKENEKKVENAIRWLVKSNYPLVINLNFWSSL